MKAMGGRKEALRQLRELLLGTEKGGERGESSCPNDNQKGNGGDEKANGAVHFLNLLLKEKRDGLLRVSVVGKKRGKEAINYASKKRQAEFG